MILDNFSKKTYECFNRQILSKTSSCIDCIHIVICETQYLANIANLDSVNVVGCASISILQLVEILNFSFILMNKSSNNSSGNIVGVHHHIYIHLISQSNFSEK